MTQTVVIKTSDESRTSDTIAADSELEVPVADGVFRVRAIIRWTASAAADIRIGVKVNGATLVRGTGRIISTALTAPVTFPIGALDPVSLIGTNARGLSGGSGYSTSTAHANVDLVVEVTGTGTVQILWSQLTTTPSEPTIVKAGSCMTYEDISALPYITLKMRTTDNALTANGTYDDDTLTVDLEPNTAYAVEACLVGEDAGTFGRKLTCALGCDSASFTAHLKCDSAQADGTPSSFSTSTTFSQLVFDDDVAYATAREYDIGGYVLSGNYRGVAYYTGHIINGDSPATVVVKVIRSGGNPGGSCKLEEGSWLAVEKLPPCAIY